MKITLHDLREVREQIQQDLLCLTDSFGVNNLENKEGKTLDELVCQIIVDRMNPLCSKIKKD
jgi:hypothetical protein